MRRPSRDQRPRLSVHSRRAAGPLEVGQTSHQSAPRILCHGCAASGTQCSHQQLAHGLRAGLPADDGAPNCIYCTPNTYAATADALGGEEAGGGDPGGSASSSRDASTAATEAHKKEAAQKHTPAPNPQGEGSGKSPTAYALAFKTAFVDFAHRHSRARRAAPQPQGEQRVTPPHTRHSTDTRKCVIV